MLMPHAAYLNAVKVENALLRAAVGDYGDEAAVLPLINFWHWLPQLQSAGLITFVQDVDGPWARIDWPELNAAACAGMLVGSSGELRVLHVAASIGDGRSIDRGDLPGGLDRRALVLVLAAIVRSPVGRRAGASLAPRPVAVAAPRCGGCALGSSSISPPPRTRCAPPHGEGVAEQVDVLPLQRQSFGLPETQGEGHCQRAALDVGRRNQD